MASKWTVDTVNRVFQLTDAPVNGIVTIDVQIDLYSDAKEEWLSNPAANRLRFPFETVGGEDIGGGLFVGSYFFLRTDLGWSIKPFAANQQLILLGNLYPRVAGDSMIDLAASGQVQVFFERSQLTQAIETGGGGGTDPDDFVQALKVEDFGGETFETRVIAADTQTDDIPGQVLDAAQADHVDPGTIGESIGVGGTGGNTADEVVEALKTEDFQGKTFEQRVVDTDINAANARAQTTNITGQVLDVQQADHEIPGTVGESIAKGGTNSATNPDFGKIFVDQDYGGTNNLTYVIDNVPVADASIEVFLYSVYMGGNRDSRYSLGQSRQNADGSWYLPFYLDPQEYVLQFFRQGVAGPDAYRLVVSEVEAEIEFVKLEIFPTPLPPPEPPEEQPGTTQPDVLIQGLDQFSGTGTVTVDHNYGGPNALTYTVNEIPVQNADILIFPSDVYNAGMRTFNDAVAASRQLKDGSWQQAVKLNPGTYVFQYFKQGVAGPDAYTVVIQ
jgi:hypothetical protein